MQTDALAGLKVNKRKQDLLKSSQKQQDLSSQNEDGDDLDMEHKRSKTTSGGEIAPSSYRQGVLDSTSKETVESSQKTTQVVVPLMQRDESEELKELLSPSRKSLLCQPKEAGMQGEGSEAFYSQQSEEGSLVSCEIVIQESMTGEAATSKTLQQASLLLRVCLIQYFLLRVTLSSDWDSKTLNLKLDSVCESILCHWCKDIIQATQ